MRVPRRVGLFLTGLAGIFGIRTPPEPQVIARQQPARPPAAPPPPAAAPPPDEECETEPGLGS